MPAASLLPKPEQAENSATSELAILAMRRARSRLVMEHPFFGSLALRLHLQPDSGCRDLWTNGRALAFNPVYAATLPENKLMAAQAHEIMHIACAHHLRRKGRDEDTWNKACDYAINHILLEAGFSLPQGFLHNPEYAGFSVDDIYSLLTRLQERESNNGASAMSENGLENSGEAGGAAEFENGQAADADAKHKTGQRESQPEAAGEEQSPQNWRLADVSSDKDKGRTQSENADFTGEVRDHPALRDSAGESNTGAVERENDIAVTQAMRHALNMGDVPAGLSRFFKKSVRRGLDWREILRRFLEDSADSDYSWSCPNRRYVFQGIYLPSRREPGIASLVLAVDSSGSVDEATLNMFCAELATVLESYAADVTIVFHDSAVQNVQHCGKNGLPPHLAPMGGGGTDYRPVWEYIEQQGLYPACLIWFTDLECDRFPPEPPFPVLWVSTARPASPPPYGQLIYLPANA